MSHEYINHCVFMARMIHSVSASKTNKTRTKLTMSAQPCSAITLPEIGGLVPDYLQKLSGRRAKQWLRALKMLGRQQHPLVRIDPLFQPSLMRQMADHFEANLITNPSELFQQQVESYSIGSRGALLEAFQKREKRAEPLFETHYKAEDSPWIVAVDLGSILDCTQIQAIGTFGKFLERMAEDLDLHPCPIIDGLVGVSYLLRRLPRIPDGHSATKNFIICTPDLICDNPQVYQVPFFEIDEHPDGFKALASPILIDGSTMETLRTSHTWHSTKMVFMTTLG